MIKPKLLFFFNGMPEYETLFKIAVLLKQRGKVEPVCFSPSEVLRREPRLKPMISQSGLKITFRLNKWLKLFPKKWLKQGDVAIIMVDPTLDYSASRPRSQAMLEMGIPTIFVQHGVIQGNFNSKIEHANLTYNSELLLLYEKLIAPEILSLETQKRMEVVGFLKPLLFPPLKPKSPLPKHERAILFCHSFRWAGRYSNDDISRFYDLVSKYAKSNPNYLIIIRSHRAKSRSLYKHQDQILSKFPNIVFCDAHKGPLAGMSMTDVLGLVSMCISTASTAVLDSIYMNKPTAIYENDQPVFLDLPNITDIKSLENFSSNPEKCDIKIVQNHYGCIEQNIERSCVLIENMMLDRKNQ